MKQLSFQDKNLEEHYLLHYRQATSEYVQWAALLGTAIMLIFALQDSLISANGSIATQIRFLGALPTGIAVFLAARNMRMRQWITGVNAFFWISYTGLVIAIFNVYGPGPYGLSSSIGLGSIFIIMFGIFALSNLPFLTSLLVGLICFSIYSVSVIIWSNITLHNFISGDFLTVLVLVLGGSAKSYVEERRRRHQFETSWLLSTAYATVEQQVRDRTSELEARNAQLAIEINERMEVADKLRASEYRFRTYFEKNADPVLIINPTTYCIEDTNIAALKLLHCSSDEVVGKLVIDFAPELQPTGGLSQHVITTMAQQTQQQGFSHFECTKQSPHRAPFPVEVVLTWIDDNRSPFILATWRDISARKQMEQQLFHAQKLESVGRLAGGVAHDFNNKLSVIMGYAELSRQTVEADSPIIQFMHEITRAAEFSREITSKLLTFSRQQIISPRCIELNPVIKESVQSLGHLISEKIQIRLSPAQNLWTVKIDPVQVEQIIMNLALNAADAMSSGGHITITTVNCALTHQDTLSLLHPEGEYVCITVQDEGSGMDADTMQHIFEPFYTTKEVGKGTGLGLSIIHGIVTQNHGFIDLSSELDVGTRFSVYLPRHLTSDTPAAVSASEETINGHSSILLIEDDERVRNVTEALLQRSGYQVTSCCSPDEAVAYCCKSATAPDLVLTDVIMPGMPVKTMLEEIQASAKGIKVLFMSGYAADMQNHHQQPENTFDFIQKPVSYHELSQKIARLICWTPDMKGNESNGKNTLD